MVMCAILAAPMRVPGASVELGVALLALWTI
jgi:hypothetical protein